MPLHTTPLPGVALVLLQEPDVGSWVFDCGGGKSLGPSLRAVRMRRQRGGVAADDTALEQRTGRRLVTEQVPGPRFVASCLSKDGVRVSRVT